MAGMDGVTTKYLRLGGSASDEFIEFILCSKARQLTIHWRFNCIELSTRKKATQRNVGKIDVKARCQ